MIWTPRTTVAAIVEEQGRYLMVEEETHDGVLFNQPAGHLEERESLLDAVVRETLEETARDFRPLGLVGVYRWRIPPNGVTYLRFCFHGKILAHYPEQPLDQGIRRAVWMTYDELAAQAERMRSPLVLRCLDDYRRGRSYPLDLLNELD